MLHVDYKYIQLVSPYLRNFKNKKTTLYNFSCPVCGDSQKNKNKARAYFIQKNNNYYFHCHNCQLSLSLGSFLRRVSPALYDEYALEKFKDKDRKPAKKIVKKKVQLKTFNTNKAVCLTQLPKDHYVVKYVRGREIPEDKMNRLYFTEDYAELCEELFPGRYPDLEKEEHRLLIPFFSSDGEVFGIQGRSFGSNKKLRYLTAKPDDETVLIYGIKNINFNDVVYVVEGPLDSLFLPNSIAATNSDLERVFHSYRIPNSILLFDNEPRNKEVMKMQEKAILHGRNVVIWPEWIKEKDINDMILSGRTIEELLDVINDNVLSGLKAKLKFSKWKRC